jgi:hypothetical protein
MTQKGHFDQFPPTSLSGCCRLGQATFAGTQVMGETRRFRTFGDRDRAAQVDPELTFIPSSSDGPVDREDGVSRRLRLRL